jgi:low temperature requirement protein LtrA
MPTSRRPSALRRGDGRVSNVELFFDLVYVFAITQLSQVIVATPTFAGALRAAVLFAMMWQIWVYTTWSTNYLDPERTPTRGMLLCVMLASLVLSAGLPGAFGGHGRVVAVAYVAIQAGRALYEVWAMRGTPLQIVYLRILPWTTMTSTLVIVGGFEARHVRELLWAVAIVLDLIGAATGFYVPRVGRSATTEWTISGSHFAERCQAFVLIALGESIVVIGRLVPLDHATGHRVLAFGGAFAGAVGLWWVYFDRAAEDSAREITSSPDPGRMARNAFHYVHPLIVGGIILTAAADEKVLEAPAERIPTSTAWLLLGGTALFLGGHAVFKAVVWRTVSWPRVGAVVLLAALLPLAGHVSALTLSICALAIVIAVAVCDRLLHPQ